MAEEGKGGPGPIEDAIFILGFILVLVVLWFYTGHKGADLSGIFLHPPAPIDQGGAYGPTIGSTTLNVGGATLQATTSNQ
jgi:hypothetical protein